MGLRIGKIRATATKTSDDINKTRERLEGLLSSASASNSSINAPVSLSHLKVIRIGLAQLKCDSYLQKADLIAIIIALKPDFVVSFYEELSLKQLHCILRNIVFDPERLKQCMQQEQEKVIEDLIVPSADYLGKN